MNNKTKKIIAVFVFIIIIFQCIPNVYGAQSLNLEKDYIRFLKANADSKSGDATVIQSGGKFALIDTGSSNAKEKIINTFKNVLGIKEFEFVILTHGHEDHVGNFKAILDANIKIKKVYMKDYSKMTNATSNLSEATKNMKAIANLVKDKIEYVKNGEEGKNIETLGNFKFYIYNTRFKTGKEITNDNLNSISTLIQHVDNNVVKSNIVVASDIQNFEKKSLKDYAETETIKNIRSKLGNANIDVYALPHHGMRKEEGDSYRNANSAESLKAMQPFSYVIVSKKLSNNTVEMTLEELKKSGWTKTANILSSNDKDVKVSFNIEGKVARVYNISDEREDILTSISSQLGVTAENISIDKTLTINGKKMTLGQVANFRNVQMGDMAAGRLYRCVNAIAPKVYEDNRTENRIIQAEYVDMFLKKYGVKTVLNLSDGASDITAGLSSSVYYKSLYNAGQVKLDKLSGSYENFNSETFHNGIVEGVKFLAGKEGPYAIHCKVGRDRTGFAILLLECLMGAKYDEMYKDFKTSFENIAMVDSDIVDEAKVKDKFYNNLSYIAGISITDSMRNDAYWKKINVSAKAVDYLKNAKGKVKMTDLEINRLKNELKRSASSTLKPTAPRVNVSKLTIGAIGNQTYTGRAITPEPIVMNGSKKLTKGIDYTLSYKNNTNVGTATITITGKVNYTGSTNRNFKIIESLSLNKTSINLDPKKTATLIATVKPARTKITWKSSNPKVAVVDNNGKITAKALGTTTITATAGGASKTCEVKVLIPPTTGFKIKEGSITKNSVEFKWNKNEYAGKYRIWMSDTGKDHTYKLMAVIDSNKTTAKVIGLKPNTKYYFKIKAINGNYEARAATRLDTDYIVTLKK